MSKPDKPELSVEDQIAERQIQVEKAQEEYLKLAKDDKRFIGIEEDTKKFWILGKSLKMKQLGFNSNKKLQELFSAYDNTIIGLQQSDGSEPEQIAKRTRLLKEREDAKLRCIDEGIPMMLGDSKGHFDKKVWFSDEIPIAVWWDVAMDCNLFLAVRGSRADIVQSMTR